jgi:hypothetical protein
MDAGADVVVSTLARARKEFLLAGALGAGAGVFKEEKKAAGGGTLAGKISFFWLTPNLIAPGKGWGDFEPLMG